MMRKYILIFLLFVCLQVFAENNHFIAVPTIDNLRFRSGPYLDSEVKGILDTDKDYTILTKTFWKENIDGLISNWYQIQSSDQLGWAFGGYLKLDNNVEDSAIRNSYLLPKSNTTFTTGNVYRALDDPYTPPEGPCGGEGPMILPDSTQYSGFYNQDYSDIILSKFPEIPTTLIMKAISPMGVIFTREFNVRNGKEFIGGVLDSAAVIYKTPIYEVELSDPIILLPFYSYPDFKSGEWMIQVESDDTAGLNLSFNIEVDSKGMRVLKGNNSNPFYMPSYNHKFSLNESVIIKGNTNKPNSKHNLILYRSPNYYELEDGSIYDFPPYLPQTISEVQTDASGRFEVILKLGDKESDKGFYRIYYTENGKNQICDFAYFYVTD